MTRKRILQTNFAGTATSSGETSGTPDHRTNANNTSKFPRFILFTKVFQSLRVLVEHASFRENRFHDVGRLHLVEIHVEQLVPKSESF